MQRCSICIHKKRQEIDQDLISGVPFRHVAARYDTSTGALQRHKRDHLPARLAAALVDKEAAQSGDLLQQVGELQQRTLNILARAENAGQLQTALYAIAQARGNMELLCKMAAYLREQQLDALSQKQKSDLREIFPLMNDPVFLTALQQAVDETDAHYEQNGQAAPGLKEGIRNN